MPVVTDLSKNSILQRFTTANELCQTFKKLWLIFQRTQYYSDSQRLMAFSKDGPSCDWSFKELNITAIHNAWCINRRDSLVVTDLSKNSILQRFTTSYHKTLSLLPLWLIFQRTQYYSDSQPRGCLLYSISGCDWSFKELNITAIHNCIDIRKHPWQSCDWSFKELNITAIHNNNTKYSRQFEVVTDLSKNSILQRFTTRYVVNAKGARLWLIKELNITAIHNDISHRDLKHRVVTDLSKNSILQRFTTKWWSLNRDKCCDWSFKELNITAIHNKRINNSLGCTVVTDLSKNSILQRFTTKFSYWLINTKLWLIFQRTQYYSDSQPVVVFPKKATSCDWSFKELNITAIHNTTCPLYLPSRVVTDLSKNSILQRFTTWS